MVEIGLYNLSWELSCEFDHINIGEYVILFWFIFEVVRSMKILGLIVV